MGAASYIALSKEFIDGIEDWIQIRGFDKEHIIEVGAGMGELGRRLGLKEDNVTDLRLSSTADNYDPLSPTGFKTCDENKNEADEEESEIPEGLDFSGTLKELFPDDDDMDDEELDESDAVFWNFDIAYGKREEAHITVKKQEDVRLMIMAMPTHAKDEFAFYTASILSKKFPNAEILYIGPDLDGKFIDAVGSPEFFSHCKPVQDNTFVRLVENTYPTTISRFQSVMIGDDFASDLQPKLFKFNRCSCADCQNVK